MSGILRTTLLGLYFGTFGTTIGGILGIIIKKNSKEKNIILIEESISLF